MKDRRRFPFAVLSAFLMSLSTVIAHAAAADGAAAAPPTPVAQFKVFKIGGYRAVALKDGVIEMPNDGKSFVVGQSNEAVGAVLKAGGAPADHLEFSIQPPRGGGAGQRRGVVSLCATRVGSGEG